MPGATPPLPSATDPVSIVHASFRDQLQDLLTRAMDPVPLSPGVETGSASRRKDRIAIAVLLCAMAFLSALTWQKWGSLLIDCGREMYIPAALSQGKRLYFDLWYPYGPLIPYWHALLFRAFGIHLSILYGAGLTIVATLTVVLYRLARIFLPVSLSLACGFMFLLTALQCNLFNYVLPYSYPAAYGLLIFVTLVWLLARDPFTRSPWKFAIAGMLAGASLLNKVEIGVAAYGLLICAIGLRGIAARSFRIVVRDILICLPFLLAAGAVYGWIVSRSSVAFLFGDNIPLLPDSFFVTQFGRLWSERLGFSRSPIVLFKSAALGFCGALAVAAALILSARYRLARKLCLAIGIGICGIYTTAQVFAVTVPEVSLPAWLFRLSPRFLFFNRGMVWVSLVLPAVAVAAWWRRKAVSSGTAAMLILSTASLALGVRILTRMAPAEYAVFYGVPAYLCWVVAVFVVAGRLSVPPPVWRGLAVVLCCAVAALTWPNFWYPIKAVRVATERGAIYTDAPTADTYNEVLSFLESARSRAESFVVWPEETSLYFFSGSNPPNRWYILAPGILPYGEKTTEYLEDLDRRQVRYVLLTDLAKPEYETPIFGADYNQQLYDWLLEGYRPIRTFGDYERSAHPPAWGVMVYERKSR